MNNPNKLLKHLDGIFAEPPAGAPDPLDSILSTKNDYLRLRTYRRANLTASDIIHRLRDVTDNVLIVGETGTGKELVAKAIHGLSSEPLVCVNAGGIPESLLEAEFFGAEKGSYTGCTKTRTGYFEQANGGTIFLDEIGELPALMQCKLLRVLQERVVRRLGGETDIPLEFRVIAATNRDFLSLDAGFRNDLYYRLATITVETTPLRDRPLRDIHLIIEQLDKTGQISDTQIQEWMGKYKGWPGNIRQLENLTREYLAFFAAS